MQKLLLISILIMSVAIPAAAAREPRPWLALRRCVWWMVTAAVVYVGVLALLYPRFSS